MRMDELTALWDSHIRGWMKGGKPIDKRLLDWQKTYRGEGEGAVDFDAMPEPWIGDPKAAWGAVVRKSRPTANSRRGQGLSTRSPRVSLGIKKKKIRREN